MLKTFLIICVPILWGLVECLYESSYVKNLVGEPDYKKVKLHWESEKFNAPDKNFQIRYCELQSWGTQRCRTKLVDDDGGDDAVAAPQYRHESVRDEEDARLYSTEVTGLRMATTYSFEVKLKDRVQGLREDRSEDGGDQNRNVIVIPTKGFSARATQCLPHASEIEVSTGPHFAGRIAVEATDGERCAIDGEPESSRDTYTLRINHSECGSSVNETTVATFVIVQENLPILTHSTRRFLVLCTYQPETLTVRAGINLPTHHQRGGGQAKITPVAHDESFPSEKRKNGRTGRLLQKPEALVSEEGGGKMVGEFDVRTSESFTKGSIVVLAAIFLIGIVVAVLEILRSRWKRKAAQEFDTQSLKSSPSCSTVA